MKRYYTRNNGFIKAHDAKDWKVSDLLEYNMADMTAKESGALIGWPDAKVTWYIGCAGGLDIGIPQ